jgi:hypothetical protein
MPMRIAAPALLVLLPPLLVSGCTAADPLAGPGAPPPPQTQPSAGPDLRIARDDHWLVVRSPEEPGLEIRVNYLEAYCRPGSTDADWVKQTVIRHRSELVEQSADGRTVRLRDVLDDGVTVMHTITAGRGDVDFRLVAHNPGPQASAAHWAQPCVRLGPFTGYPDAAGDAPTDYLDKCFVFVGGKLTRMPFEPWATTARYTPGQVWCPAHVPRTDVNPRPLSTVVPSNGLIGCFGRGGDGEGGTGGGRLMFATAWEPYQELFQGVARCLHSDFRIGGLRPGETKRVRGKIYVVPADPAALLARYARDFPEHVAERR